MFTVLQYCWKLFICSHNVHTHTPIYSRRTRIKMALTSDSAAHTVLYIHMTAAPSTVGDVSMKRACFLARTPRAALPPPRVPPAFCHTRLSLVLVFASWLATLLSVSFALPPEEVAALIDFYHATGGSNWQPKCLWTDLTSDPCFWPCVSCGPDNSFVR